MSESIYRRLFRRPPSRRWLPSDPAAVSGTLGGTLGALTCVATGVVAIAASGAITLGALTSAATGTVQVAGTGGGTLAPLTVSSAGVVAVTGQVGGTLAPLTSVGVGTVAVVGTSAPVLAPVTLSASGIVADFTPVLGSLAQTLGNVTASSTGLVPIVGTVNRTLADVTGASAGLVQISGTLARTLGNVTAVSGGSVAGSSVTGSLAITLDAVGITATGTVTGIGVVAAPDSSDIDNALVAKLQADATLMALMPGGVWMDEGPPGSTQHVIVSLIDEHDEGVFGARGFEDALYLVKAVELSTVAVKHIKAAAARIDAVLEDGALTVAGYTHMVMCREDRVRLTEVDGLDASIRWHHRGGRYRVQSALVV